MRRFVFRYNPTNTDEGIKRKENLSVFPECFQSQDFKWDKLPGSELSVYVNIEKQNYTITVNNTSHLLKLLIYQDKAKKLILVTNDKPVVVKQKVKKATDNDNLAFVCENCDLKSSNSSRSYSLSIASYFFVNGRPTIKTNNKTTPISNFRISKKDKLA